MGAPLAARALPELTMAGAVVLRVGRARHEVRVVDGFLAHPAEVRRHALGCSFEAERGAYPGARAPVDFPSAEIIDRIEHLTGWELEAASARLSFSIVTRSGREIQAHQRTPHVDATDVAGVLYLNPPEQCRGGTAFYRHRASGLEAMPSRAEGRVVELMRDRGLWTLGQLAQWLMTPPADEASGFLTRSTPDWELMSLVPMRFNRLVLYEGALFHSGFIEDGWFGNDLSRRRLTLNGFADLRRREP